jgi:two-component system response regulator YesN
MIMYRVLLVDDETLARKGLRSAIRWEEFGCQLVGEASNGSQALPWIERGEIDILITDIRMPIMDGLELTRAAMERCPWLKVLLLSCHSDFEYVREGLRLGASDYILKATMEPQDLKRVLERMKAQVLSEKERLETEQRNQWESICTRFLAGEPVSADEVPWIERRYRLFVASLDWENSESAAEAGECEWAMQKIKTLFHAQFHPGAAVRAASERMLLIVPDSDHFNPDELSGIEEFGKRLREHGLSFCFGASLVHRGVNELRQAYREAKQAAEMNFFQDGGIFEYCAFDRAEDRPVFANRLQQLKRELDSDRQTAAEALIVQIMEEWKPGRKTPDEVRKEAQELIWLFSAVREPEDLDVQPLTRIGKLRKVAAVRQAVLDHFQGQCKEKPDLYDEYGFHGKIVRMALDYIHDHYTEFISLQDVAQYVSISKNYLSELFKKVTGQNFIEYLIELRINKAKELLSTTTLKVYEVAEQSGFKDVKYFSKLFKKYTDMSPYEYRSS